jgi:hypothetical protein
MVGVVLGWGSWDDHNSTRIRRARDGFNARSFGWGNDVEEDFVDGRSDDRDVAVGNGRYGFGVAKAGYVDRNVETQVGGCCQSSNIHQSWGEPVNST